MKKKSHNIPKDQAEDFDLFQFKIKVAMLLAPILLLIIFLYELAQWIGLV